MKVAILGAGNAGCAVGTDLSIKGHEVTLIKTSNSMHDDNYNYMVEHNGEMTLVEVDGTVRHGRISRVTRDVSLISEAEVVIIYIQTRYHESLIKRVAPYFKDGQIVIINPGYFSTAYMLKYCGDRKLSIVEATSSFIDCRISEPGTIKVGFRNVRNPLGVYPPQDLEKVKAKLESFDFHFHYWSTVEVALHNPNLIVHTVGAIMSIPRIEKTNGDYCMYHEVFTPACGRSLRDSTPRRWMFSSTSAIPACPMSTLQSSETASTRIWTQRKASSGTPQCPPEQRAPSLSIPDIFPRMCRRVS